MEAAGDSTVPADGLPELLTMPCAAGASVSRSPRTTGRRSPPTSSRSWAGPTCSTSCSGRTPGSGPSRNRRWSWRPHGGWAWSLFEALMVGDTAHDLHAGRAAGMETVLVTGSGSTVPRLTPEVEAAGRHRRRHRSPTSRPNLVRPRPSPGFVTRSSRRLLSGSGRGGNVSRIPNARRDSCRARCLTGARSGASHPARWRTSSREPRGRDDLVDPGDRRPRSSRRVHRSGLSPVVGGQDPKHRRR